MILEVRNFFRYKLRNHTQSHTYIGKYFSLQLDEYIDISKNVQLLTNVYFVDGDTIWENFLFCKILVKTTGKEIFRILTE